MPVSHQYDEVDTAKGPQVDSRTVPDVGHGDAAQRNGNGLVSRHSVAPFPGAHSTTRLGGEPAQIENGELAATQTQQAVLGVLVEHFGGRLP